MTSKFQKGDQVQTRYGEGLIVRVRPNGEFRVEMYNGDIETFSKEDLSIRGGTVRKSVGVAKKFSKTMAELTILAKKIVDADLKNLIKAGWLDSSLQLTQEGEEAVLAHYLSENKAAFGKMAEEALKERKKDKDCK